MQRPEMACAAPCAATQTTQPAMVQVAARQGEKPSMETMLPSDQRALKTTYTVETPTPRATAMAYSKRLVRLHGVPLRQVNYRRGPDGVIMVTAPQHPTLRFSRLEAAAE
jgi:pyruvate/2-oxoglutarate dehydrogenase complex dihydrolipoamide acyltransferase (E2) component